MSTIIVEKHRFELQVQDGSADASAKERMRACEKLGLKVNAQLSDIPYPEITGYDLVIWDAFLPSSYSCKKKEWEEYYFDCIPQSALDEIESACDANVFTDIEIWTPEKRRTDPLAVGVLGSRGANNRFAGGRFFKIVRWGESLLPFEEIERRMESQLIINKTSRVVPEFVYEKAREILVVNGRHVNITRALVRWCCGQRAFVLTQYRGGFSYMWDRKYVCAKCGLCFGQYVICQE